MHLPSLLHGSAGEVTTPLPNTVQEAQLFSSARPLLGQAGRDRLSHGRTVKHSTSLVHNAQCCRSLAQRSHLPTAGTGCGTGIAGLAFENADGEQPGREVGGGWV